MTRADIYATAPKTFLQPIFRGLQIAFWIDFRPSVWYQKTREIRPNLPPNFCLAELNSAEWRSAASRQLLLTPLMVWPGVIFGLILLFGILFPASQPINILDLIGKALSGACVAFSTSLLMSTCVSFTGGLMYGIATGLVIGLVPLSSPAINLLLAFCAGLTGGNMRANFHIFQPIRLTLRTVGAIFLWVGLIATFLIVGVSIANEFFFNNELNVNSPYQNPLSETLFVADFTLVGISFLLMTAPRTHGWARALKISTATAILAIVLTFGMHETASSSAAAFSVFSNLNYGVLFTLLFGLAFSLVYVTGWSRPAIYLGAFSAGVMWVPVALFFFKGFSFNLDFFLLTPLAVFAGLVKRLWRPLLLYFPLAIWNWVLFIRDLNRLPKKSSLLIYHPAFWDELNYITWPRLDQHLILVAQHDLVQARQAMLTLVFGRQRTVVSLAHLELAARHMETLENISDLNVSMPSMETLPMVSPFSTTLERFTQIAKDVEIAEKQTTVINTRTAMANIREQVLEMEHYLHFSQEPFALRFRPVTAHWLKLLTSRLDELARIAADTKEIENPYVVGVPVIQKRGAFVGRVHVFKQIEQMLLAPLRPPLFLYGQRRMGKTSLLLSLTSMLPSTILPLFVDCQGLSGAKSYAEVFYYLVKLMQQPAAKHLAVKIPSLSIDQLPLDSPFLAFNQWLDQLDGLLEQHKQVGLIILDEFVALDEIFQKANLPADDFLMLIRHIIQHRQNFRVLISGSYSLEESNQWASYLINTQTIKLSYLQDEEARNLIENPVNGFPLAYQPEAVNKIMELTHRHPALIQILCYDLVEYKNTLPLSQRYLATPDDVEAVVPKALAYGAIYFEAVRKELPPQALKLLGVLALKGSHSWITIREWESACPEHFTDNLRLLLDRDLVEAIFEDSYRFEIELVRRWFESKAKAGELIR